MFTVGVVAALAGLGLFLLKQNQTPGTISLTGSDATGLANNILTGCKDTACMLEQLKTVVAQQDPATALLALRVIVSRNAEANGSSHALAHAIGHATYAKFSDSLTRALTSCRDDFASGCYHGVMEMRIGRKGAPSRAEVAEVCTAPEIHVSSFMLYQCVHGLGHGVMEMRIGRKGAPSRAEVAEVCTAPEIHVSSFMLYQCVHGLGHGVMMARIIPAANPSIPELTGALEDCDATANAWEQSSCYSGVYMEFINAAFWPAFHYPNTPKFKRDDPQYPCNGVPGKYARDCYIMQATAMLMHANQNFAEASKMCAKALENASDICHSSLGREASGRNRGHELDALNICASTVDQNAEGYCLSGAVKDIVYVNAKPPEGFAFCSRVKGQHKPICYQSVGEMIWSLEPDPSKRREVCKGATEGEQDCLRGAQVVSIT
jgi:hypothetical protein